MVNEVPLYELASRVRSKLAKSYHVTFDIFFNDKRTYERVKESGALNKELVEQIYKTPVTDFVWFDQAIALKVTIRRQPPSGGPGENDQYSCQQHIPLYDIKIPWY